MHQSYDVIVVGAGGMGSAATYHLARRGLRVLALERFGIAHEMGSSHGLTRIIRLAYYEHPSYVPLLRRAFELWRELEARAGERLLHVTGAVDAGPPGSRVFEGSLHSCRVHDLRHEVVGSTELARRFPGYQLPRDYQAVVQPDGGFLLPERCIAAHVALARAHGADVRTGVAVEGWDADSSGIVVRAGGRTYRAAQLVLCAGAWMPSLVPSLAPVLVPERQVLAWLAVRDHARFAPERFPVFVMDSEEGHYYGFPEFDVPGFKLGKYHHLHEVADPDRLDRAVRPDDVAVLRSFAARHFPDGAGEALRTAVCMFTNTADEHFLIDRLPGSPAVLAISACSGHGFKFCSVVGEIAADLVQRGETAHDVSLFRLRRLTSAGARE